MGVSIDCKGKEILDIKNSLFYSLHEGIIAMIKAENLEINDAIQAMLEKMDQNVYGPGGVYGVDIADYLKTRQDALLFADLVKRGIEKEHTPEYPFSEGALERFWNFHKEILDYAHELKNSDNK